MNCKCNICLNLDSMNRNTGRVEYLWSPNTGRLKKHCRYKVRSFAKVIGSEGYTKQLKKCVNLRVLRVLCNPVRVLRLDFQDKISETTNKSFCIFIAYIATEVSKSLMCSQSKPTTVVRVHASVLSMLFIYGKKATKRHFPFPSFPTLNC